MGASPSCDYSTYVPKSVHLKNRTGLIDKISVCDTSRQANACNFSEFIASAPNYIPLNTLQDDYVLKSECNKQMASCREQKETVKQDALKYSMVVPCLLYTSDAPTTPYV